MVGGLGDEVRADNLLSGGGDDDDAACEAVDGGLDGSDGGGLGHVCRAVRQLAQLLEQLLVVNSSFCLNGNLKEITFFFQN